MDALKIIFVIASTIILFLFSLQGFSNEIKTAGADKLQVWLSRMTQNRWSGFLLGLVFTGFIQSSSAVSGMAVALVDAGVLSLRSSLAVLLGANVGTTLTAWMVTFKITGIGPIFIVIGYLVSLLPKYKIVGKSTFYLGFIFFSLDLISQALKPISEDPELVLFLQSTANVPMAILVGIIVTAVVQSSSVTTGIVVLMVQQKILDEEIAIAIAIGANIGTTSTALIASIPMERQAKLTAISNFIFNLTGVVLILPFFYPFVRLAISLSEYPSYSVAYAHLILNLMNALLFLIFLKPFETLLLKLLPRKPRSAENA
jgi:phosphate:Na+ symporter